MAYHAPNNIFRLYRAVYSLAIDASVLDRSCPLILTFSIVASSTCVLIFASNVAAVVSLLRLRKELDDFYATGYGPMRCAGLVAPIAVPPFFIGAWLRLLFHAA